MKCMEININYFYLLLTIYLTNIDIISNFSFIIYPKDSNELLGAALNFDT